MSIAEINPWASNVKIIDVPSDIIAPFTLFIVAYWPSYKLTSFKTNLDVSLAVCSVILVPTYFAIYFPIYLDTWFPIYFPIYLVLLVTNCFAASFPALFSI